MKLSYLPLTLACCLPLNLTAATAQTPTNPNSSAVSPMVARPSYVQYLFDQQVIERTVQMVRDPRAQNLARQFGLQILNHA